MRYGPIPENKIEEKVLARPASPQPVFDTLLSIVQARTVMVGVELGVFEALRSGALTSAELAETLDLDAQSLELALRVLACAGYVDVNGDGYRLTELSRRTMLDDSPTRYVASIGLNAWAWKPLARLDELMRSGEGIDMHRNLGDADDWANYQQAMLENARRQAPMLAKLVPVRPGAKKLLDIAGSHGLFGAMICRENPPMRSEVLDLPDAVEQSRGLARDEGIDDVVTHRPGDARDADLGEDAYDVCFLGNILHHLTPEQILDLLGRAKRALRPGGTVAIWEVRGPEPDEPPEIVGDGCALYFRLISTSNCWAGSEYTGWLEEAGFDDVQIQPSSVSPFQVLATGRMPS